MLNIVVTENCVHAYAECMLKHRNLTEDVITLTCTMFSQLKTQSIMLCLTLLCISALCSCSFIGKPNSSSTRRFPPSKHFIHSTGIPPISIDSYFWFEYFSLLIALSYVPNASFHFSGACYSAERDYYEILGVSRDASRDEIKKAFHAVRILCNRVLGLNRCLIDMFIFSWNEILSAILVLKACHCQ